MTKDRDKAHEGIRLVVLMACHNRRETTLRCLSSLSRAIDIAPAIESTRVVLVDDGSSDSTGSAARGEWPGLRLIEGSGSLYWAGAMALAEATALSEVGDATHLMWLNDDVVLDQDSMSRLSGAAAKDGNAIICCALRDPQSQEITYSGLERTGRHPLRFRRVAPSTAAALPVETFNGNLVLVPLDTARGLGGIDGALVHQLADLDYGYRATKAGISVVLAPGSFGSCPRNDEPRFEGSLLERWREFHSQKRFPFGPRRRFLKRHGGRTWPIYLLSPYPRFLLGRSRTGTEPPLSGGHSC